MATLSLSNTIEAGTEIVAAEHQQNYTEIENFVNGSLVQADGSVGMDAAAELLLGTNATQALGAVPKQQLDAYDTSLRADLVPRSGDTTITGSLTLTNLTASGQVRANSEVLTDRVGVATNDELVLTAGGSYAQENGQLTGKKVYLVAEAGAEVVSSPDNWGSSWAGRYSFPVQGFKFPSQNTRVYNNTAAKAVNTTYTVTVPSTVGGIDMTGAVAVLVNITAANSQGAGSMAVWGNGQTFNSNSSLINFNTLGHNPSMNTALIPIGSSRQFSYRFDSETADTIIVDVMAVLFG